MMGYHVKLLKARRVRRAIEQLGFIFIKEKGHAIYRAPNGARVALPLSHPEIPLNVVRDVLTQAGIGRERFESCY